jgi:glycosyltransferase involved in cell wall biosynthesis
MFTAGCIPAVAKDLWPDVLASPMNSGQIPFGRRLFARLIAPPCARRVISCIPSQGIAWILGPAVPRTTSPALEQGIKRRGVRYIFHILDDWFSVPHLRPATVERARLADLIVVPTPRLLDTVFREIPGVRAVRLEEPVDVDRLRPIQVPPSTKPVFVWTGNMLNLCFLDSIVDTLAQLSQSHDFILRIISKDPPSRKLPFAHEWFPYSYHDEARLLSGAVAGLAPLEDSSYNQSKGAFKIKTYMAAGLPVVASDVGYQTTLVSHGSTGFLCEKESDWLHWLKTLLSDPHQAHQMGQSSREMSLKRFSHDAVQDSWVAAVRSLSDETPRSD